MDKTVIIGLDGATFTVLDPLIAEGHCPELGKLVANGVRAELCSTPHPLTPPAWTTLMTGRSPGHHGVFDFLRAERRASGAFFTLTDFRDIRCETIWTLVSRQGGSVTSLNFPLMSPPPEVNGSIVPGQLSHRHLRRNVHPKHLFEELKALPSFDPKALNWDFEREKKAMQNIPDEELVEWTESHIVRERHWMDALRHVMRTAPADLTAVLFDGVDKLQHTCWRFLDPAALPTDPNPVERRVRELCIEYFRALDGFIGEIVQIAGPDARIFLASDHGFGGSTTVFRANTWLHEQGLLAWPAGDGHRLGAGGALKAGHHVPIDMERTQAYAQSAATNGIHIRVAQSPGDGGVPPEDYHRFRDALIDRLLQIRHPRIGVPIVKDILKREDAFPGPCMEEAPDLTLVMHDHSFISVLRTTEVVSERPTLTGTHFPEGIFIAHGPGIRRGFAASQQSILDCAATYLHSLCLPVPEDFESRVIEDVFAPDWLRDHPVEVGQPTRSPDAIRSSGGENLDAEEEAKIVDRLRALGYVE
jgi:predicted AlkP superfamily phosphohydrolase/phosphomutase